ncbi:hydroxymethylbilane synthase [Desulfohalotomaculum tongense]|uniref:hydroxymethylbilane synthase n=1 Tax=Desulforadius tongensis TaxID=1216062 RepID=UPI00195D278E|nr:hydroxymethylbilane synthase [Desulforadius tongensis]MBM7855575.1 hydroxymethylbilane synthase [Desulforadius tongensis]
MKQEIIVGTRESALAVWQTNWVVEELKKCYPDRIFKIVKMKTQGDKILDVALAKIGDKGLFTKELEVALLEKQIDFAVHSMKDLPTKLPDGLTIGAICRRENPADVLISPTGKTIEQLPRGARLGTSSLRRCAQLLKYRPDLKLESLRGNLNTRMKKLHTQRLDGIVLAAAGVTRMGWEDHITQYIPYEICLPAVGQGALGIEIREDDREILDMVKSIEHKETCAAITAERALMRKLEGGCQVPIGALGQVKDDTLYLEATVVSLDGAAAVRAGIDGPVEKAEWLGIELAHRLLEMGADEILEQVRKENGE